jgi:hypothetical protein
VEGECDDDADEGQLGCSGCKRLSATLARVLDSSLRYVIG